MKFSTCDYPPPYLHADCSPCMRVMMRGAGWCCVCTGLPLSSFAEVQACVAGQAHQLPGGLALQPVKSRHAEACYGLLVHWQGSPVLGWTVRPMGCGYTYMLQQLPASHALLSTRDVRQGVRVVVATSFACQHV